MYVQTQASSQTMQMLTLKTKDIIVVLFFDMNGLLAPTSEDKQKLVILLHAIKSAFERKFLAELMDSRGRSQTDSVTGSQSVRSFDYKI